MLGDQRLEEGDYYLSPEGYKGVYRTIPFKRGTAVKVVAATVPLVLTSQKKSINFDMLTLV